MVARQKSQAKENHHRIQTDFAKQKDEKKCSHKKNHPFGKFTKNLSMILLTYKKRFMYP